jgi:hypothetical protein
LLTGASSPPEATLRRCLSRQAAAGQDNSALFGSPCEELRWLVLNGFTTTSRAAQMSSFMLGDVFDMLENLAALRATISVRRHRASPL